MKILITGATGRIGRKLVDHLKTKHQLVLMGRSSSMQEANFHKLDLSDEEALVKLFADEQPQAVVHLAGLLAPACAADPRLAREVNVEATENLAKIAFAHKIKTFIFASSSAVYNQTDLKPTDEFHNLEPQSVYGKNKLEAEKKLEQLAIKDKLNISSLRLFNIYGPGFDDSLVNKLLESTAENPAMIYGPNNFYRDYIHISDAAKAFEEILNRHQSAYKVYNVGSGTVLSNEELVAELKKAEAKVYFKLKENQTNISWADISRIIGDTGWRPKFQLSDFVKEFKG